MVADHVNLETTKVLVYTTAAVTLWIATPRILIIAVEDDPRSHHHVHRSSKMEYRTNTMSQQLHNDHDGPGLSPTEMLPLLDWERCGVRVDLSRPTYPRRRCTE